ncbi:MAG: preprotein translocase subunit SecE [Thermoanaerobaculia bacterium]
MDFITKRWRQFSEFLSETRAEMKKVTFPPREQVVSTTIVVVITSVIFAIFLWIADLVILKVYGWIYQVLGA